MKRCPDYLKVVKAVFPSVITLALLALPHSFLNPGGILALIPIFYFFIFDRNYMNMFMVVIFLGIMDYNQSTILLWVMSFLLMHAALSVQNMIILKEQKLYAAPFFTSFVFIVCLVRFIMELGLADLRFIDSFYILMKIIYAAGFASALYIPFSFLFEKLAVHCDRPRT